jgi:ribosomal protein S18 acetylase RimI-like enzyme
MIIEKAKYEDLEKILELQKIAFQEEADLYQQFHIPPLEQTLENIRQEFEEKLFLKALEDNRIVGSVRAKVTGNDTCYVGRLMVHPNYQNMGIGTKLMNEIERYFKDIRRFELFTGDKSEKNICLYKKLGYNIIKEVDSELNIRLVVMEKLQ